MEACNESTPANNKLESATPLLGSYRPLEYTAVRQEVETLKNLSVASLKEWKQEESIYEESFYDLDSNGSHVVETPRRNYPNDRCKVKDPTLYPYHDACYPLLEAYTGNGRLPHPSEQRLPGQLLCSVDSINATIRGLSSSELGPQSFYLGSAMEDEWHNGLERRLQSGSDPDFWHRFTEADKNYAADKTYGLAHFPTDPETRADILLKLLRHAMSDLQNDLSLAGQVIFRMSRWKLFQTVDNLQRALCIIGSELKDCEGTCFENLEWDEELPDHSCLDWASFRKKMSFLICSGMEYFTEEHAVTIAGHMQLYLDNINPAAAELEASLIEEAINRTPNQSAEDKHRTLLKQQLYLSKNTHYGYEDEEDSDSEEAEDLALSEMQREYWTDEIIIGLSAHGILARQRVMEVQDRLRKVKHRQEREHLIIILRRSVDSFYNCTRCLVYIGESVLRRLTHNPRVVGFCSRLVLCLVRLFLKPSIDSFDTIKSDPRTYLKAGTSLIDPNRYAESILAATKNYQQRQLPTSSSVGGYDKATQESIEMVDRFLGALPDKDVQDLVWCFFAKDLVSPMISRCGYGDIQVWWGLPVTPLDPLLFLDDSNGPEDAIIENIWDQMIDEPIPWETDEEGNELWGDRLHARYDFSLVLLLCAWHAPWSTESHFSFQRPIREVVTTLLLCANRIHMPTDIVLHVCSYLPRHWWPDEREQCFFFDCLGKRATKLLHQKLIHQMAGTPEILKRKLCTSCSRCRVSSYCCKAHEQSDYRECHKWCCGMPPFRFPGQKEKTLFNDVLRWHQIESARTVLDDAVIRLIESQLQRSPDVEDEGSGSWESVESEEDEVDGQNESLTVITYKFFERECYRIVRSEDEART